MKKTRVESHFDSVAKDYDLYKRKNKFYYDNLKKLLKTLIPEKRKVFEVGCGTGDLIKHLNPSFGIGFDLSREMIKIAKLKNRSEKKVEFTAKWPEGYFDYIFMSDVIEHLEDPKSTFNEISKLMNKNTRFICTMANPIWEPVLLIAEKLKLKMPEGPHRRINFTELKKISEKAGLKIIEHDYKLLVPIEIPVLTYLANRYLEKPLKKLAFIEYLVFTKT